MDEEAKPSGGAAKRGVLCSLHGLHYNPELTSGCVLCLRDAAAQAKTVRRGSRWLALLCLLGVVALAAYIGLRLWGPTGNELAAFLGDHRGPAQGSSPGPSGTLLDPAPYEAEIRKIEEILDSRAPSYSDLASLDAAVGELSSKLAEVVGDLRAARLSRELVFWSGAVTAQEESGYAAPSFAQAELDWRKLRDRYFERAEWFRKVDNVAPAESRPRWGVVDPRVAVGLQQCADEVARLIDRGSVEVERYDEILGGADPDADRKLDAWRQWSREWDRKVEEVAARLPRSPAAGSRPNLELAHQSLSAALSSLRSVTKSASEFGVPPREERRDRFKEALGRYETAQKYLSRL